MKASVYGRLFARPEIRAAMFWSFVGRLPLFLVSLGIVLFMTANGGSYALAGLALAVYTVGGAALGPLAARQVDRRGRAGMLKLTAVAYPSALLVFVTTMTAMPAVGVLAAAVAGGSLPPVSASYRALLSSLPFEDEERTSAYALEAVTMEVLYIVGPLILSGLLLFLDPAVGLVVGGLLGSAGAVGLARSVPEDGSVPGEKSEEHWLGPLRSPGLLVVFAVIACGAFAVGLCNLALPAFAADGDESGKVGLLFASWGVGSTIGGLWYGTQSFRSRMNNRFALLVALFAAGLLLPLVATDLWTMALALAVGGTALGPLTAVQYELVGTHAPSGTTAQAFTWVMTGTVAGSSLGTQLGGLVIEDSGVGGVLTLAAVAGSLAALVAWFGGRRHLMARPGE
ncbi:MFS transporter [Streptomyces sp. NPDC001340]